MPLFLSIAVAHEYCWRPLDAPPPTQSGGFFQSPIPNPLFPLPPTIPLPILEGQSCREDCGVLCIDAALAGGPRPDLDKLETMLKVILPDGSVLEFSHHVRPIDIAAEIGPRLAKATLAAEVDGQLVGADAPLPAEGQIALRLLTAKDPEALDILRHSCAHVMARAVMRLFEGVQLAFGPTVDNGFYYDFQMEHAVSEEDFPRIEAEMARIVKENEPFERVEMARDEALQFCQDLGQTLKVEHLREGLADEPTRVALPAGRVRRPLPRAARAERPARSGPSNSSRSPGPIGRATPARQQLQRLYGTAWFSEAGPRRPPAAGRRGQAPRSSRAGKATGAVPDRSGGRFRAGALAAQGGGRPPRNWKTSSTTSCSSGAICRSTRR